jgi:putative transposase
MPQSLSFIVLHLIFSTSDRFPFLDIQIQPDLHSYLATVARNSGCECYRVGGTKDHVHLSIRLSRTITIAELVEKLKTASSLWIKKHEHGSRKFSWQKGYGCFSINPKNLKSLNEYIQNQEEHHRTKSFQEEYRMFLGRYGVEYNESYVWD